ncbi:hypothetical protein HPB51_029038 [Rhipicephalus microplus]|uniref:Uncharacterized protein n=1 Tax=Rhipicephalus microplus TaxID=6941 RepID=A0A9J6CVP4_RHIMP|nr:hypothetical protein HPB51_029038 [Rhipicephalus microplus]
MGVVTVEGTDISPEDATLEAGSISSHRNKQRKQASNANWPESPQPSNGRLCCSACALGTSSEMSGWLKTPIPVVADLPVGRNLQDRMHVDGIAAKLSWPALARFNLTDWSSGLLTIPGSIEALAFVSTRFENESLQFPDVQIALQLLSSSGLPYKLYLSQIGVSDKRFYGYYEVDIAASVGATDNHRICIVTDVCEPSRYDGRLAVALLARRVLGHARNTGRASLVGLSLPGSVDPEAINSHAGLEGDACTGVARRRSSSEFTLSPPVRGCVPQWTASRRKFCSLQPSDCLDLPGFLSVLVVSFIFVLLSHEQHRCAPYSFSSSIALQKHGFQISATHHTPP